MVRVNVVHAKVGEVVVTAELAWKHVIRAVAQHDHTGVLTHEYPALWLREDLKTESPHEERSRSSCVVHGQHIVVLENRHPMLPAVPPPDVAPQRFAHNN